MGYTIAEIKKLWDEDITVAKDARWIGWPVYVDSLSENAFLGSGALYSIKNAQTEMPLRADKENA